MVEPLREHAWTLLCHKLEKDGYHKLTEHERIWVNVDGIMGDVSGGGLISFFYNHGAENYEDTIEDLNKIKAVQVIELVKKIGDMFPEGIPPKNIDDRNEIIDSWNHDELAEFFEELDDQLYDLMDNLELKLEPIIKKVIEL